MTLVLLTACWVAGIVLARSLGAPLWPALACAALAGGGLVGAWRRRRARLILACALCLALGAGRMAWVTAKGAAESLQQFNDRGPMTVTGWVCAAPSVRSDALQVELCAEQIDAGEGVLPVGGKLLTALPRYANVHYGTRLAISGRLETPPILADFDYREYLLARGIRSLSRRPSWSILPGQAGSPLLRLNDRLRERLRLATERSLPDPEAGLLNGILLGLGHTLPDALYTGYQRTGLAHIIVISGFNLSLVVQLVLAIAGRLLHRWRALWFCLAATAFYALFVGASPPVVRAALMAAMSIIALRLGRRAHLLTSVASASLWMTAANPLLLWSASFQLSFAATLALALLEPRLADATESALGKMGARRWLPLVRELLLATLAAQLATLPILIATFDQVSLIAPLANVLALPAQAGVMLLGAPVPLVGLISPTLGRAIGLPVWTLLRWTNLVVSGLARLPWAAVPAPVLPASVIWAFYGALVGLAMWPKRRRATAIERQEALIQLNNGWRYGLPVASVLLIALLGTLPDGRLHLVALDVGQGDAVLLRTPRGHTVLIDGGPDPLVLTTQLGDVLPFWQQRIDLVISTHSDSDHLSGLVPVAQRYTVGAAIASPCASGELSAAWLAALAEQGVAPVTAVADLRVEVEPGVTLTVLHPQANAACGGEVDANDQSVVCLVEYGAARILLTGDVSAEVERRLVDERELGAITLLKVSHHGAATATGEALLAEAQPRVAIISVGADNRYGHPSGVVLARLAVAGSQVYRTDEQGTLDWSTDGERYWVEAETTLASEVRNHE
ncbi:MAG: DNA internalization-related competence protein ComEC/Rec2 [Anaerolineales bacterium]